MPLPTPLKKYAHGPKVKQDEVYMFKRAITPEKEMLPAPVAPRNISSPILDVNEDSMDAPPSVGSVESVSASPATPGQMMKRVDPKRKKLVTAYILFSADVRKITMEENPGVKFGEISRIVAERWRAMSDSDKQVIDLNLLLRFHIFLCLSTDAKVFT